MEIQFYCPRWGSEYLSWELFLKEVVAAGYYGIEYGIGNAATKKELDEVWDLAEKYKVKIIAQCYDTGEADFSKHLDLYCAWFEKIKAYPIVKIDSQTGRDFFSFDRNKALINEASHFTEETGIQVVHETHRNKLLFAAHVAKEYLEKLPGMKITLDASHWVCVAESFLEDQASVINLAIERTDHVHARVGYPEGPQVPDPRVAEWRHALDVHLNWWDKVAERKQNDNAILTITPEFGPYPYMVYVPETGKPVSDQWDVNVYMMELLKKRYS
jgi:sugar phosphate isomerase/epimerase